MMRKFGRLVPVVAALLLWAPASLIQAKPHADLEGKTYYTTANIWYDKHTIPSINYRTGDMVLPVGTKVVKAEILDVKAEADEKVVSLLSKDPDAQEAVMDKIAFMTENGERFLIHYIRKYSDPKMKVRDYFNQYFSEQDPTQPGGAFHALPETEKQLVKAGEVEVGMSKAAVLMAWGYPPSRKTPSLKDDRWMYWENRRAKKTVIFMDGKVIKIK
jgi:hypothetical protein